MPIDYFKSSRVSLLYTKQDNIWFSIYGQLVLFLFSSIWLRMHSIAWWISKEETLVRLCEYTLEYQSVAGEDLVDVDRAHRIRLHQEGDRSVTRVRYLNPRKNIANFSSSVTFEYSPYLLTLPMSTFLSINCPRFSSVTRGSMSPEMLKKSYKNLSYFCHSTLNWWCLVIRLSTFELLAQTLCKDMESLWIKAQYIHNSCKSLSVFKKN